jgi:hypothetical protein
LLGPERKGTGHRSIKASERGSHRETTICAARKRRTPSEVVSRALCSVTGLEQEEEIAKSQVGNLTEVIQ